MRPGVELKLAGGAVCKRQQIRGLMSPLGAFGDKFRSLAWIFVSRDEPDPAIDRLRDMHRYRHDRRRDPRRIHPPRENFCVQSALLFLIISSAVMFKLI